MFGRTLIGRFAGIPIYASGLLLVMLGAVGLLGLFGEGRIVVLALLLLVSVFLHEIGHALVARRLGMRVIDIVLGPLVCSARMVEIPEDPRIEASIAVAGPAVNFLLALLTLPLLLLLQAPLFGDVGLELGLWFIWVNLVLGGFNLLPGFPMDGGRILRSLLARRMGWLAATERAVQVGRIVAVVLAVTGLFLFPRALLLIPIMAVYLWIAGTRELWVVRQRHGRSPLTGEPMPEGFGPFAGFGMPFADAGPAAAESTGGAPDVEVQRPAPEPSSGARRPRTIDVDEIVDGGRSGIGDDLVRRLEGFRGRLPRRRTD